MLTSEGVKLRRHSYVRDALKEHLQDHERGEFTGTPLVDEIHRLNRENEKLRTYLATIESLIQGSKDV